MNKVKFNYWLDVVIGLAFLMSAITGIAFLFMGSGGYQGGRNAVFHTAWLGVSRTTWSDLHTLGSLVMIMGVGIHLAFHWKWIACVTKQIVPELPKLRQKDTQCEITG
ncbi:MAG: DUF4405 domain-containing protein [Anaerolineae bacterium]|nr:DUF4405 domain-containing protein [Anaerolineae bacterium]